MGVILGILESRACRALMGEREQAVQALEDEGLYR